MHQPLLPAALQVSLCPSCPCGVAPEAGKPYWQTRRAPGHPYLFRRGVGIHGESPLEGETGHRQAPGGRGPASLRGCDLCRFKDQSCVCTVGHPSSRPTAPQRSRPEFTLVTADLDPCRRSPVTGGHKRRNAGVHTFASHQALHSISPSLSFCFCEMGIINAALPNLCVWERSEQDLHKPQGALSIPGRLTWGRGHAGAGGPWLGAWAELPQLPSVCPDPRCSTGSRLAYRRPSPESFSVGGRLSEGCSFTLHLAAPRFLRRVGGKARASESSVAALFTKRGAGVGAAGPRDDTHLARWGGCRVPGGQHSARAPKLPGNRLGSRFQQVAASYSQRRSVRGGLSTCSCCLLRGPG